MDDSQKPLQEASGTRRSDQSESKLPIRDGLCSSLNGSREDDVLEARTRGECMRVARHRTANEKVEQRSTDLLQTSIVAQPSALYNTSHGYPFRQGCHPHRRPFERSVRRRASNGRTVIRSTGTRLSRDLTDAPSARLRRYSLPPLVARPPQALVQRRRSPDHLALARRPQPVQSSPSLTAVRRRCPDSTLYSVPELSEVLLIGFCEYALPEESTRFTLPHEKLTDRAPSYRR